MSALNFPASPTVGQVYTAGGVTWTWDGTSWAGTTSPLGMATSAQWLADTAGLALITDKVWGAAAEVALTDAATIALDMSTFINAAVLLTTSVGSTRTLGNPTNAKQGQTGVIKITQPASGGPCTLNFGSNWKFQSATAPSLSTGANATDFLSYYVDSASFVVGTLLKAAA